MNEDINKEILTKVIGKKLFESTWHDYAHPYIAIFILVGIFFILIADALISYFWIKDTKKHPIMKSIILAIATVVIILLIGYIGNIFPRIGPTTYQGYINYLNERTHGLGAETARELWKAHINGSNYIFPNN